MSQRHPLLFVMAATIAVVATPSPITAQVSDGQAVQRRAVLETWVRAYTEWKEWDAQWLGRLEPGLLGPRERRTRPDPPDWLAEECLNVADPEPTLADACRLLVEWRDDYATAQVRAQLRTERQAREASTRTAWWNHVHVDALWLTPNASVSYGVVGVHATLKVAGRWQVFVAPGAILLNVPTPRGGRAWQPATDLGFSYRLFDFRVPGGRRQNTLHLNLARAWLLGGADSFVSSSVDLAGFSVTFK